MNFIAAIQHATIGYGIYRKAWRPGAILHTGISDFQALYWTDVPKADVPLVTERSVRLKMAGKDCCEILGPDPAWDLSIADLKAKDWQTV